MLQRIIFDDGTAGEGKNRAVSPTYPFPVEVTGSADNPVSITSQSHTSSVAFARTADTAVYNALDVLGVDAAGSPGAAALTFANIGPALGGNILIINTMLRIDLNAVPSGMLNFLLELYSATPPSALVDNNAYNLPSGDRSVHLGTIDLGTPVDKGDTLVARNSDLREPFVVPVGGTLYGYLKTVGGYTPASGTVHTVRLFSIDI